MRSMASQESWIKYLQGLLAVVSLASIIAARILNLGDSMTLTYIASGSFVLIALVGGGLITWFGRIMVAGLIFCFLGDILGPGDFLLGLYAFLVGHLFFMAAFWLRGMETRYAWGGLVIFLLVTFIVMAFFFPHIVEHERIPAVAYAVIIALMMVFAAGTWGFKRSHGGNLILAGALLFYVSDLVLAAWHFVGGDFPFDHVCYPLYYLACILLAFSAGAGGSTGKNLDKPQTGSFNTG